MLEPQIDVIRDVLPDDPMYSYPGAAKLYFEAGPSALRSIQLAMSTANLERVERVLDFACGGGRVMRYLRAAFADAELTACDTWQPGLEFCVRTFGAKGVLSAIDPADVVLDGPFDLIWCGSLLTHVDGEAFVGFLRLFESVLAPGGVLVFTTRGRLVASNLKSRKHVLMLEESQVQQVVRDYQETGFGYYPRLTADHGECVSHPSWVCGQLDRIPHLRLLLYFESAWLDAQDVVACTK